MIEPHSDDTSKTLAVVSSTLLAMMKVLGRIEERLMHLESLTGVAPAEYVGDGQSVMHREWDPVARRWVYEPEPH